MAYNEQLAARIRQLLGDYPGLSEKQMFGGLAFLVYGNMAVAASGQGGLLVRVDPAQTPAILASSNAAVMVMRGKQMPGWLRVSDESLSDTELSRWIALSTTYAGGLPEKASKHV